MFTILTASGIGLGFILVLLYLSGIALAPATMAILAFVAFVFVIAYARYAKHIRATSPND